jgi:L-iditol 2-dehydrogenase
MKALLKYAPGPGNLDVREVPEPECGDDKVKVEVAYCGVCGTDIHVMHDTFRNFPPVILGHEFSGTVVETGKNVSGVRKGERVTVLGATAVTCGRCRYCRSGYFIFCKNRRGMGHGVNGAFTRYAVVRPDQLYRVPENFSLEEASISEPFAAVVQAVTELTTLRIGEAALVSGPGPIGLLAVKLLVSEGIRTIVAGAPGDEDRLSAAKQFGADAVVNIGERKLSEAILELTEGAGVDAAFECAGHPSSVRGCMESLRPLGQYTQVAICGRDIEFPIDLLFYKQLTMRGSITYTANTWDRMMSIYATGRIRFDDLISHKLPISDWENAFNLCVNKKALKVVMYPID